MKRLPLFCLTLGFSCLVPAQVKSSVSFSFNFTDASGVGFNAAGSVGADRRAALQQAGDYVASHFVNYTANIVLDVNGGETNDSFLASAGSNANQAYPGTGFGNQGDVMLKILGGDGADPAPALADGVVTWNFQDFDWFTGNTAEAGKLDLISTGIHELTHAVGFLSEINFDGSDNWGNSAGDPSSWSEFERFVGDASGTFVDQSTFQLDLTRWNAVRQGGTGAAGIHFWGTNAVAANGGNPLYLYSPTAMWESGSSGSHLDTNFYNPTNGQIENMMNHSSTFGEGELDIREYSAIELGLLRDIGYTNLVPEPSSTLLLSFGVLGMFVRRRV